MTDEKKPKPVRMVEVVPQTRCPFCKGEFSVAREAVSGEPSVLHTMPPCQKYLDLDSPADYLAAVRMARRN